jgi:hypothetical protein
VYHIRGQEYEREEKGREELIGIFEEKRSGKTWNGEYGNE